MAQSNLLILICPAGSTMEIPEGFLWASINPGTDGTYTITNSLSGEIVDVSKTVTSAISVPFTFPSAPSLEGYKAHTIAATTADALITYTNGN